jgi:hypothetical protein
MFGFGLPIEGARAAYWGARAIADGPGIFGLLYDRQSWDGEAAPCEALRAVLRAGLLDDIRAAWAKADPLSNNAPAITLIDTGNVYAAARRSYGYVHIGVALRAEDGPVYESAAEAKRKATAAKRKATLAARKAEDEARAAALDLAPYDYEATCRRTQVYVIFKPEGWAKGQYCLYDRQYRYIRTVGEAERRALLVGAKVINRWAGYGMASPEDAFQTVPGDAVWIAAKGSRTARAS